MSTTLTPCPTVRTRLEELGGRWHNLRRRFTWVSDPSTAFTHRHPLESTLNPHRAAIISRPSPPFHFRRRPRGAGDHGHFTRGVHPVRSDQGRRHPAGPPDAEEPRVRLRHLRGNVRPPGVPPTLRESIKSFGKIFWQPSTSRSHIPPVHARNPDHAFNTDVPPHNELTDAATTPRRLWTTCTTPSCLAK